MMLIAQLSDLHISTPESSNDRLFRTAVHLARAVTHLNRLTPAPDVVILTGDHRAMTRRFAGTIVATCPATAHQIALEIVPARRLSIVMEPPACLLHLWLDGGDRLVTHTSLIGDRHPALTVFDGERWADPDVEPPPGFHELDG